VETNPSFSISLVLLASTLYYLLPSFLSKVFSVKRRQQAKQECNIILSLRYCFLEATDGIAWLEFDVIIKYLCIRQYIAWVTPSLSNIYFSLHNAPFRQVAYQFCKKSFVFLAKRLYFVSSSQYYWSAECFEKTNSKTSLQENA
jgi:hypothetical protein